MPLLGPEKEFARRFTDLEKNLLALATAQLLANASSDGPNGSMSIVADAVSGQPALSFTYTGGGGSLLAQLYQTTAGAIQITGGLQVSGTKNFSMNHPTKPGYVLRHASTESPVNGVEYWGTGTLDDTGAATITLPEYFEALTSPNDRAVFLTPQDTPAALAYTAINAGAFTVTGPAGVSFSWLVKTERVSQPGDWPIDFNAEEPGEVLGPASFPAPAPTTDTTATTSTATPVDNTVTTADSTSTTSTV